MAPLAGTGAPLLVCCGLATLDVVQVVDAVPGANQKVVARELTVTFGGPAANAAATAVALGVPTRLVTALGRSPIADLVRGGLAAAGVEVVDLLADRPGAPAVSTVLVTRATGERAVVSVNATATGDLSVADRADELLGGATAVLVDGHHLSAAVELASRASVPVLLDGGSWKPGLDGLLQHVDHAVLSADFRLPANMVPPGGPDPGGTPGSVADLLAMVAALGPTFVAQSSGAGPVQVRTPPSAPAGGAEPPRLVTPPVIPADEVVDTLGAGDVLHGAMAAALARGIDPLAALARGVARASESVRHAGALGWATAAGPR
ncbi:carbohydrate kinase [Cellulomonas sp. JH27-2]|uniref:PfkB family carbohydrate kinase n=1 Tax=Cellulomonas sp. JH27-2 TaxID=2774139 RepID=UPI00177ABC7A|nr:PfkB family carbohydrate kinase [Cellulomonas sp. JH27-2]MBD8060088.1 carbohydrate kinase [Cellulomonas sp. JH27-2]